LCVRSRGKAVRGTFVEQREIGNFSWCRFHVGKGGVNFIGDTKNPKKSEWKIVRSILRHLLIKNGRGVCTCE